MKRTRQVVVAVLVAMAVVLASVAVGGFDVADAGGDVRGVTDTQIKVGGLGVASTYGDAQQAAEARFAQANQNNEIPGGREIVSVGFADDNSTADTNIQEARRLVDQEGVFAIVPAMTSQLGAASYLNQQTVPTVGWGIAAGFCDQSDDTSGMYLFGFSGAYACNPLVYSGNNWGSLINQQFKNEGVEKGSKGKTAAAVTEDSDGGRSGLANTEASLEANGMEVVYAKAALPPPPATVNDYSPYAQDIMTSADGGPPDVVFLALTFPQVAGISRALTQAGYTGVLTNAVGYDPRIVEAAQGWSVMTGFATPEADSPEIQEIVQALNDAGVTRITQTALAGWFSADMFVGILKKTGKNLTPERFQKKAAKFTYEVEGVIGPTVYPASFKAGLPCGQLSQSNGTEYVVTASYACYDLLTKKGNKFVQVPYPSGVK